MALTGQSHRRKAMTALLLFALVCLPISGAASHYCFDGLEPAVSYHFDNFSGHHDHDEEIEQHLDLEKPVLDDNLVSKKSAQNLDLSLLESCFTFVTANTFNIIVEVAPLSDSDESSIWHLRSPLRAPPSIS